MLIPTCSYQQCDEGKPHCTRCIKSSIQCPGYRPQLDVVLRNQNEAAKRASLKGQGRALARREHSLTSNRSSDLPPLRAMSSTVPITGPATAFYFMTSFQDIVSIERANCPGYIEFLPSVFSITASNSALALATQALASSFHGAWTGAGGEKDAENRISRTTFGEALLATQNAILDPIKSKSDETLMAVLVLRLYEVRIRALYVSGAS